MKCTAFPIPKSSAISTKRFSIHSNVQIKKDKRNIFHIVLTSENANSSIDLSMFLYGPRALTATSIDIIDVPTITLAKEHQFTLLWHERLRQSFHTPGASLISILFALPSKNCMPEAMNAVSLL